MRLSLWQTKYKTSEHLKLESCLPSLDNLDLDERRMWRIIKTRAGKSQNEVIPLQSTSLYSLVTMARCSVGRQVQIVHEKKGQLLQHMVDGGMKGISSYDSAQGTFQARHYGKVRRICWCLEECVSTGTLKAYP